MVSFYFCKSKWLLFSLNILLLHILAQRVTYQLLNVPNNFLFFFPNERVELTEKLDDLTLLTTDASSAKIVENPLKLFKVDVLLEGHKAVTKHFSTGVCVSGCVQVCFSTTLPCGF
ncbi:hypothetical protein GOODEAATRI_025086 [Goodea atripinnis]|uniref:Uncharacterized protein n=1 Tax=Goodea atripinnis TaxID=208336 RepID=A0ABV0NXJ8_9TELE